MTIDQLRFFIAIIDNKTFSQAAMEMNISQSSLSKQIAKLEQELETVLFDRSRRQVTLTIEGDAILEDAKNIVAAYGNLKERLNELSDDCPTCLRIAMLPIFHQLGFAAKIDEFIKKFPNRQVEIDEIEERDILENFPIDKYDIFILRGKFPQLKDCWRKVLLKDHLVAVVNKKNPLALESVLSLRQLENEKIYLPPKYTSITKIALDACVKAKINPTIARYGRVETLLASVNSNQGIALLMNKSLELFDLHETIKIQLDDNISGNVYLYCHHRLKNCKEIKFLCDSVGS